MAWAYAPGMRVVCIDATGIPSGASWAPVEGAVYTVSAVGNPRLGFVSALLEGLGLRLAESDAAPIKRERWFTARRFRPLDERRLDALRYHLDHPPLHAFDVAHDADRDVLARPAVRSPSASVHQRRLREAGI